MLAEVIVLAFLTGGSISGPMEFDGVGTVYRYQGKANFSWQTDEALQMMRDHCGKRRPVIVSTDSGVNGVARFGNNYVGSRSQSMYFKCK